MKILLPFTLIALFVLTTLAQIEQEKSKITSGDAKAELIRSYNAFKADEASAMIDLLRAAVERSSNSKGFIIVYCGKICRYGEVEAHLRGIQLALELKGVEAKQFIITSGGYQEKTTTEFWFVPENSCPIFNSTIKFKNVKFIGNYKKKYVAYECC